MINDIKLKLNNPKNRVYVGAAMAAIVIMAGLIGFILDSQYAKNLDLHGKIISINWKSSNHSLPEFRVLNSTGVHVKISHSSIILSKANVKTGDFFEKNYGDSFCFINGKKTKFAR